MLWLVMALGVVATILMIKGGGWYFKEDPSPDYAPIKRKGMYYIAIGASIVVALAFWNEFVYKKSDAVLKREEQRIAAICTDVVKAYNKSKEPIEQSLTEMKLVQFPFLPKASSTAIGGCQFSIQATVEATYRTGGTHKKTYDAVVSFDQERNTWQLLHLRWLD